MKLTQQQIDELRAWQHEKAPGGTLWIEHSYGYLHALALKSNRWVAVDFRYLKCHD